MSLNLASLLPEGLGCAHKFDQWTWPQPKHIGHFHFEDTKLQKITQI